MNKLISISLILLLAACTTQPLKIKYKAKGEQTTFQTASEWLPEIDIRADVAIIYGINQSFEQRLNSWKEKSYQTHFMTGTAWGNYTDYLDGTFDGKKHYDEGQVTDKGIARDHNPGTPYMVPTNSYTEYLKSLVKRAIDGGAKAIYLEEPEFFAYTGYSKAFKQEWEAYYKSPWQPLSTSPEIAFKAQKLKSELYRKTIEQVFRFAKQYSTEKGNVVACYVPTHSVMNYAMWEIISPEGDFAKIPELDGFIGQVWTGTARTPNFYNGKYAERTFETAFLEYGALRALSEPYGKDMIFLTDPIEDNPNFDWNDYKINYEATFTAKLMHPQVARYEVMPWPQRIFFGKYKPLGTEEPVQIPTKYATQIQIMINALNQMEKEEAVYNGPDGIGILTGNSLMYQRYFTFDGHDDSRISSFYGMALPLLKRGVPVQPVLLENITQPTALSKTKVLLMNYMGMKPLSSDVHNALANWVKQGGQLLFFLEPNDPWNKLNEWWINEGYTSPEDHLFNVLGISKKAGTYDIEKGAVHIVEENPVNYAMSAEKADELYNIVGKVYKSKNADLQWKPSNYLSLTRGFFELYAIMDESPINESKTLQGNFIDLYDGDLPLLQHKILDAKSTQLFVNLDKVDKSEIQVIAASSRVEQATVNKNIAHITLKGPLKTNGIAWIVSPTEPKEIKINNEKVDFTWEKSINAFRIEYNNSPDGVDVSLVF